MLPDRTTLDTKYAEWLERIEQTHHAANHRINPSPAFAPLGKRLSDSTVALVSTAGVHLDSQKPFHVETPAGDASWRIIPNDVDPERLVFTHTHYDTSSAEQDHNVVLPIQALEGAVADGRAGAASPFHVGMMGFNPDPTEVAESSGPAVASLLREAAVDVVVLAPG